MGNLASIRSSLRSSTFSVTTRQVNDGEGFRSCHVRPPAARRQQRRSPRARKAAPRKAAAKKSPACKAAPRKAAAKKPRARKAAAARKGIPRKASPANQAPHKSNSQTFSKPRVTLPHAYKRSGKTLRHGVVQGTREPVRQRKHFSTSGSRTTIVSSMDVVRLYYAKQEAIETLVWLYEVEKIRRHRDLIERFANIPGIHVLQYDEFARYAIKMATGSGKTKVMALATAWQYFNAVAEGKSDYARTFLVVAPNVIVFERLRADFGSGRIFQTDPIIPPELRIFWDMDFYMRGDPEELALRGRCT